MKEISKSRNDVLPFSSTFSKSVLQVLGFAALTAICSKAHFFLPFTPVPVTLQTLAVLLSGAILGPKKGALSQVALIGMAACGLPVFVTPGPGYLSFVGPTAGYIVGFVLSAFVAGYVVQKGLTKTWLGALGFLSLASLVVFIPGLIWLGIFTKKSISDLFVIGFFPYLIGDAIKVFSAAAFVRGLSKREQ